jgi:excisionase family DNA binding protein
MPNQEYMDAPETAALIRRTTTALYRMVARGQIPYRKCGRRLLFRRSEIERFLAGLPGRPLEKVREERHR